MKQFLTWSLIGALCACGTPQSSFAFNLSDKPSDSVSGIDASGEVDNAGFVALDDGVWQLDVSLGGLSVGTHTNVDVTLLREADGVVFATTLGGTCTVVLDPHDSTNGSAISGVFYCTGLVSSTGLNNVNVSGGQFLTYISDSANNPNSSGPSGP